MNGCSGRAGEFQSMSNQLITEMFVWEKELEIDKEELTRTLKGELVASGIKTPFEFAIIRGDTLSDGIWSKVKEKEFRSSPYQVNLFSEGLMRKGETVSVVFPLQDELCARFDCTYPGRVGALSH